MRHRSASMATLAAALAISACGGKGGDSAGAVASGGTASTAGTAGTQGAPADSVAAKRCVPAALALVQRGAEAGAGNRAVLLSLRNRGAGPCTVRGYPSVRLIDSTGSRVQGLHVEEREGSYFSKERPVTDVTLAPGEAADFDVTYNVIPGEPGGCLVGRAIEIALPGSRGDSASAVVGRLRLPVRACAARMGVTPLAPHAAPARR